jgi:hypothetical protein
MSRRQHVRCPSCGRTSRIDLVWSAADACPYCRHPLSAGSAAAAAAAGGRAPGEVLSVWVESFNARDLEGMLALMDPRVVFHPLRVDGVAREYHGHDGVREWFAQLSVMGNEQRLRLIEVRSQSGGQGVGFGDVLEPDGSVLTPFWSLTRVRRGGIVAAYHYLTDPDIMEYVRGGEG